MANDYLVWVAVYNDGTNFAQFNEDGTENSYHNIDRTKLTEFHMVRVDNQETVFAMALEPEQRLVFRRRVSMSGDTGEILRIIYLVGWQQTVGRKNVQSLNWILPDLSIVQTGKFREDSQIFYEIAWMEDEKA